MGDDVLDKKNSDAESLRREDQSCVLVSGTENSLGSGL